MYIYVGPRLVVDQYRSNVLMKRGLYVLTYICEKRRVRQCRASARDTIAVQFMSKETFVRTKRDLYMCEYTCWKETCRTMQGLCSRPLNDQFMSKEILYVWKETYIYEHSTEIFVYTHMWQETGQTMQGLRSRTYGWPIQVKRDLCTYEMRPTYVYKHMSKKTCPALTNTSQKKLMYEWKETHVRWKETYVCVHIYVKKDLPGDWPIQPVPEKMKLEMFVERQIEILDSQSSGLFSNEPWERRPVMTIEDFDFHFDDHFASHLLRNGRYKSKAQLMYEWKET